jgi:small subunit ribosomal protein S20
MLRASTFSRILWELLVANTRSAEKQNRQAQKHRVRNTHVLSTLRSSVRKFREAAATGDAAKTKEELAAAVRQIAKAASKGVIHKAQASRRISRLTKAAHAAPPKA